VLDQAAVEFGQAQEEGEVVALLVAQRADAAPCSPRAD
jgi:hypothetical protein